MKWAALAASGGLLSSAPWPVTLGIAVLGAGVYICRLLVIRDLGRRAIDKAEPRGVPEILSTITGSEPRQATPRKQRASK